MNSNQGRRIWEIDFLRGGALILMIVFHVVFDLKEFFGYPVVYNSGFYFYLGKVSGSLFIIIAAISCSFSRSNFKRAVKFLAVAMLITVVSHLYNSDFGIKFGILHFLGLCILIYPMLRKLNNIMLTAVGTAVWAAGKYLGTLTVSHNYLFLFNLTGTSWVSSDYYPLFPWLGVFMYGMAAAGLVYRDKQSVFKFSYIDNPVSFLGRHTLPVYLIHQPVLLMIIGLVYKYGQHASD